MCGRFTLTVDPANLRDAFTDYTFPTKFAPRFNIAPSQPILAIPNNNNAADFFIWGLIPSWATPSLAGGARADPSIGKKPAPSLSQGLINARAETLAQKPSFRGCFKYKRCLSLADGFYEWKSQPGTQTKIPHFIHLQSRQPFAFAGLWDEWHSPDGGILRSATIITTRPNELISTIHNRMPVILHPGDYSQWLDSAPRAPENLLPLLKPFPAREMAAHPVSMLVNSPANDRPECLLPA